MGAWPLSDTNDQLVLASPAVGLVKKPPANELRANSSAATATRMANVPSVIQRHDLFIGILSPFTCPEQRGALAAIPSISLTPAGAARFPNWLQKHFLPLQPAAGRRARWIGGWRPVGYGWPRTQQNRI